MSAGHTDGRLVVIQHPGSNMFYVAMQDIRFAQSLTENAARRLAACWNAFDGMPTEAPEELAGIGGVQGLTNDLGSAMAVIEVARTLLSDALETFDDNPHQDHEVSDRIRAFLAGEAL